MDPIVANAILAVQGMEYFQNIPMAWNFEPEPLNDRQREHIQMSIARCEQIYATMMARPPMSEEMEDQALNALNNAVFQLEHVENAQQFMEVSQIVQVDINYWEAKVLFGNEEMQFFNDDLDNNGQPWDLAPERRRRDARRG